ncbi:MAG: hypothetical protein MPN21_19985 [Thermoanaerobaculia bacterium]|nr:hypothetical protein [Thermoanaerobaculia bacterium]
MEAQHRSIHSFHRHLEQAESETSGSLERALAMLRDESIPGCLSEEEELPPFRLWSAWLPG